jgi:hypothetical protein
MRIESTDVAKQHDIFCDNLKTFLLCHYKTKKKVGGTHYTKS